MAFCSILYPQKKRSPGDEGVPEPDCFTDLNLHEVVGDITLGYEEYNLKPFFHRPLHDIDAIRYRQQVMADLDNPELLRVLRSFSQRLSAMRGWLSLCRRLTCRYNKEGWFIQAVKAYCDAVHELAEGLDRASPASRGLLTFRSELRSYRSSEDFLSLAADTNGVEAALSTVQYSLLIRGGRIRVRRYQQEDDYGFDMDRLFEQFRRGEYGKKRFRYSGSAGMTHVEARIIGIVARFYPDVFLRLDRYYQKHKNFCFRTLSIFEREVQFYLAYLHYLEPLRRQGLPFCYPEVVRDKQVACEDGFDIALAGSLTRRSEPTVCNDFFLQDQERIIIVSGPNQGGKTTFARAFGQIHYLASLGCLVPGRRARLFLFDRVFTHFEKEEQAKNLRGKLQDDLIRIHAMLEQATGDSIMIINEIFTSTTLKDGLFLSRKIMEQIAGLDMLCVYVTFIAELSAVSDKTVSMISAAAPGNPALRTYKILRKPAAGAVYALYLAEKYRLTYDQIRERIR